MVVITVQYGRTTSKLLATVLNKGQFLGPPHPMKHQLADSWYQVATSIFFMYTFSIGSYSYIIQLQSDYPLPINQNSCVFKFDCKSVGSRKSVQSGLHPPQVFVKPADLGHFMPLEHYYSESCNLIGQLEVN